jgi:iron complex transport system substrate-binding protein
MKATVRWWSAALSACLLIGAADLAGAGGTKEADKAGTSTSATAVSFPLTVEDDYGQYAGHQNRSLTFIAPVRRIVVGEKGCALTLAKLGVVDRVVGASEWIIRDIPGYEKVKSIGGANLDVELIVSLAPDVYVDLVGHSDESDAQLATYDIPIYTVGTVRSLAHVKKYVTDFGRMFDRMHEAQAIIDDMTAKEKQAAALAPTRAASAKPTVFMFGLMADKPSLLTWAPSGQTIVEDLITRAGGRCLTAEQGLTGWPEYSVEKLLASDPDIIILPLHPQGFTSLAEFSALPIVQTLKAVQNKRVYGIESSLVFDLSYKDADALLQFARFINP